MPDGAAIILTLKILVSLVTVILIAAIVAVATGRKRLHGRLNTLFFVLTMLTVVVFEGLIRFGVPISETFSVETRAALRIHLYFAVPSALLLPVMLWSGATGRKTLHKVCAAAFAIAWAGTFVTGVFWLPHE